MRKVSTLQDALKAKHKEVKDAEAAVIAANEAQTRAESKLAASKAEHEKALKRAKAAGVVPDIPGVSKPEDDRG